MTLLDAEIQSLFGDVFGGIYLDGTLTTVSYTDDGMGGLTKSTATSAIKIQRDNCTEAQRLELGYSPTDVRLLVLQLGATRPRPNDLVTALGEQFMIATVGPDDPGRSYWEIRAVRPL